MEPCKYNELVQECPSGVNGTMYRNGGKGLNGTYCMITCPAEP